MSDCISGPAISQPVSPLNMTRETRDRDGTLIIRVRSNSEVATTSTSRPRCSSVNLPSYQRYYSDNNTQQTRDQFNIHPNHPNHRSHALKRKSRLSTFSFRSRASSVSSFSSASSGSSCSSSSPGSVSGSQYNTEVFWNKYRRQPDCNPVTNLIRRARLRNLVSKERKYCSALDLYSSVM